MPIATAGRQRPTEPECPVLAGLGAYLQRCGGRDTLHFETTEAATAAARTIRARNEPGVNVDAQYTRVMLSLVG